jgi:type II secretory pathway component GspD/PulD (secretin)
MFRFACLAALLGGALLAQNADQPPAASLPLVNSPGPATIMDLTNIFRSGADCRNVSYDEAARAFHLGCTDPHVAMAQWLLQQVDRPAGAPTPSEPVSYTYTGTTTNDAGTTSVRMFFLNKNDAPSDMQDLQNVLRTGADMQRVFPINVMKAEVVRGYPEQVDSAEWAIRLLDGPAQPGKMASGEFGLTDVQKANPRINRTTAMRVFWFANFTGQQWMVDIQNLLRTGADVQRLFPVSSRHAIMLRTEPERAALAEWLVQQLDQKPQAARSAVSYNYVDPEFPANSRTVRILFLKNSTLQGAVDSLVMTIRTQTPIQRVMPVHDANAIVVEGRPEQVAAAEKIVADADNAAGQPGQ